MEGIMRFEDFRYGLLRPVIASFYHWSSPEERNCRNQLTKESITEGQLFYVSDDIHSWASPWVNGMKLYMVDVLVRHPLPLFEQMMPRAFMDIEIDLYAIGRCHYDAVVYTPHPLGRGVREMCLLHPKTQIQSIVEVKDVDLDKIRQEQNLLHPNWNVLRSAANPAVLPSAANPAEKVIPPWEEIPAMDLSTGDPLKEVKNDAFHTFMDKLRKRIKKQNDEPQEKLDRIEMIKNFSSEFHQWQATEAERVGVKLQPDQIIAGGEVYDYTTDLETLAGEVLRDQHQRKNAEAWPVKPVSATEQAAVDPIAYREPAGEELRNPEAEVNLDSLARVERTITIQMLPPEFKEQQQRAAERAKTALNPDEMIINNWVFTWEDGVGEILEALARDPEAKAALSGVSVEAVALQLKANQQARNEHEARMMDPRTYESVDYAESVMMGQEPTP
jgi:hypothetical protein